MMHHEFTELMSAVLDREAPPGDVQRLHQHLDGCSVCTQTWRHWQSLDAMLVAVPHLAPPPSFVAGVASRLAERRQRQRRRRWLGSGLLLGWAVSLGAVWLVVLGLGAWGYTHPQDLGQFASSATQTLNGLSGMLQALRKALTGLGPLPISLGLTFYMGATAFVAIVWFWLMARKSVWGEALSAARDMSA